MKFKSETELEEAMIPLLNDYFKWWSFQIPCHAYVIDFGGLTKDNKLVGIEFKLKDWKKAIWQAYKHSFSYDFLYILMPKRKISRALKIEAKKVGIGVLLFNGQGVEIKIKPKLQRHYWPHYKKRARLHMQICPLHKRKLTNQELNELRINIEKLNLINSGFLDLEKEMP